MLIDKQTVEDKEIEALRDTCASIDYDLNRGHVRLNKIPFPDGWSHQRGVIVFNLPDDYRQSQPTVYLPSHLKYQHETPRIMLPSMRTHWKKHCLVNFRDCWNPERHTMVTILRVVMQSLKHPNSTRPLENYYP